ncbi:type VI secretion system-associated FHA domain protein [Neorhizobium galegae]|uniref:type VI secretion system-associated FHA domain protein n=1 Tax=Neorhizobium galegae TaxID=399 RepID=UPI0012830E28|nr:FHA domain-containing protein [Neorhizobium galegae]KAA9384191.1 FHA domain-containing protein [Neorhizobium galegae]MCM2498856.1 FHA domain-containing protein [Neorhizobium galegae]
MRLELRQIDSDGASPSGGKWFFERGRRTLGRAPDCDWRLPEDQRSVSKFHCTIERDREGFLLRDQSANGTRVDGHIVHEGESARLAHQSMVEVGNLAFEVRISGERDEDLEDPEAGLLLSDEPLTISAILADIAPGGRAAGGILGERVAEDWSIPTETGKEGSSPSRNVEIGWNGPPEIRSATKFLPDDWNADEGSDYGSHLEHGSATHVSAPALRVRTVETLETVNDNVPPPEPLLDDDFPRLSIGRAGELAERLEPLLGRLDEALDNAFAVFELKPRPASGPDIFGRSLEEALVMRAEALLDRQMRLNVALEDLVREVGRQMEPRVLEARIDAGSRGLRLGFRSRDYWQAYKAQFEKNGRTQSIREVFRDAMMRAAGGGEREAMPKARKGNSRYEE